MNLPSLFELFSNLTLIKDDEKKEIRVIVENFFLRNPFYIIPLTEEYKIAKDIYKIEECLNNNYSLRKIKISSQAIIGDEIYNQYKDYETLSDEAKVRIKEKLIKKYNLYKTSILIIKSINVDRSIIILCWFIGIISMLLGILLKSILS